ncbi:hypothetical protein SCALM49S_07197 [Streptomyces californicus]
MRRGAGIAGITGLTLMGPTCIAGFSGLTCVAGFAGLTCVAGFVGIAATDSKKLRHNAS